MTACFSLNNNIVNHVHEFQIKEFRPHGYSISNRPDSDIVSDDDDDNWDKLLKDSIYTILF